VSAGDECPNGSAVFHTTLRVGPNSVGRRVLVEMPEPFGPRNRDQPPGSAVSAAAVAVSSRVAIATRGSGVKEKFITGVQKIRRPLLLEGS
jgi:hypothetical protein